MAVSYTCKHLHSKEEFRRPSTFLNPHPSSSPLGSVEVDPAIEKLHRSLRGYGETQLYSLPDIAKELGFAHVFLKDESCRFGLPSFKIAGASWAIYRALCKRIGLEGAVSLGDLRESLRRERDVSVVTCTDGNWGRAVARMAKNLEIAATVYVPEFVNGYTQNLIRDEGAEVKCLEGASYDDAIAAAAADSRETGAILVMDTSLEGYHEISQWVVDGYPTILIETDRQIAAQTGGKSVNLATCSVGVGSWAQAVAAHYKAKDPSVRLVTVEPDTAASFKESLHNGRMTPISTGHSIMNGMNCGTTSVIAWPVLRGGVWAATVVSDLESHESVKELETQKINAGPCGAANLAALRRICRETEIDGRAGMVVVLFSTEGMREYTVPEGS